MRFRKTLPEIETLLGIPAGVALFAAAMLYCFIGLCVLAVVWPICVVKVFLGKLHWPSDKKPVE
jgi:hypothetical protein